MSHRLQIVPAYPPPQNTNDHIKRPPHVLNATAKNPPKIGQSHQGTQCHTPIHQLLFQVFSILLSAQHSLDNGVSPATSKTLEPLLQLSSGFLKVSSSRDSQNQQKRTRAGKDSFCNKVIFIQGLHLLDDLIFIANCQLVLIFSGGEVESQLLPEVLNQPPKNKKKLCIG